MIGHKTHSLAHGPTALESSWCVRAWVGDEGATAMHIQQGPLFCSFRFICSSAIARASPNRRSTSQARRGQGSLLRAPNCGGCGVPSLTLQRARRKKSLNSPAPHKVRRRPWRQGSRMVTLDSHSRLSFLHVASLGLPVSRRAALALGAPALAALALVAPALVSHAAAGGLLTRLLPRGGASLAGLSPRDEVGSRKCGPFLISPNRGCARQQKMQSDGN